MPLILQLSSSDPALREAAARRIEVATRLTIGRGGDNDLVLPDPDRHLSKNHCAITFEGGGYAVTDTSTNGVFLDGAAERLPRGVPVGLAQGSVIRLGNYELTVTAVAADMRAAPPPAAPSHNPLDDPFGEDPFAAPGPQAADPFAAAAPAPPLGGPAAGSEDIFGGPPSAASLGAGPAIPDDVDLFGDNRKAEEWRGASHGDHAPAEQGVFIPPKAKAEAIPEDWDLSDLGVPLGTPAPLPVPPAAIAAPSPAAATAATGDSAALAAFLGALGFAGIALSDGEKRKLMRLAGEALVATIDGLTEILAARANTKQEFRIERTTIGAVDNNPLKFAGSRDEALRAMLLGRIPGFLNATQAIAEGLDDIKSHQIAVLAGMQVALTTVIARFDPAKLEQRIEQSSLIEGILPAARKARYWELFKALYKEIARELEDDFQKLFGAEFARAYKQQIEKL